MKGFSMIYSRILYGLLTHVFYMCVLAILFLYVGSVWYHYMPWSREIRYARAIIYPTHNSTIRGMVTFIETKEGIKVVVSCRNLTPGKHGFHVHEHGDAKCIDGMCTGEHFNPTHSNHGSLTSIERHMGDFGNLEADAEGNVDSEFIARGLTLNGPNSIIGRSVIVHAQEDDLQSQPSGNSGARIGCGIIGIAISL